MRKLLILAATSEALFGLILLVYPLIVIRLLFNSEIGGAAVLMSRIAGIALIALGVACWPDRDTLRAFLGMLTYGVLAMLFFIYVAVNGGVGILLWPGVAVHAGLSVLLLWAWRKDKEHRERT
jgi:hypothetical protein